MEPAVLRLLLVSTWTWVPLLSAVLQEKLRPELPLYVREDLGKQHGGIYVLQRKLLPNMPPGVVVGSDWWQFLQNTQNQQGAQSPGYSGVSHPWQQGDRHSQREGSGPNSQHPPGGGGSGGRRRECPLCVSPSQPSRTNVGSHYRNYASNRGTVVQPSSGSRPGFQHWGSDRQMFSGYNHGGGGNHPQQNQEYQTYQRKIVNHQFQYGSYSDGQNEGPLPGDETQDDYHGPKRGYQTWRGPGQVNKQNGGQQTSFSSGRQVNNQQPSNPKQSVSFSQKTPKIPEQPPSRQTNSNVRYHTYAVYPHSKPQNERKTSQWLQVRPPTRVTAAKESEKSPTSGSVKYYSVPSRGMLGNHGFTTKRCPCCKDSKDGKPGKPCPSKTKEQSYETKKIPDEKRITVPPLGSDSVVSGAAFSKKRQNVGFSQGSPEGTLSKPQGYTSSLYVYKHPHGQAQAPGAFHPRGYRWQ